MKIIIREEINNNEKDFRKYIPPRYTYRTLSELGKAKDIGFSVEECWNEFTEVHIEPNFDNYPFEKIYASYEAACKKHNWL